MYCTCISGTLGWLSLKGAIPILGVVSVQLYYVYVHVGPCSLVSVLPKTDSKHGRRAWFGRGLWSHQSFLISFLSHIKQKSVLRLAGPTCLKYAGENTACKLL